MVQGLPFAQLLTEIPISTSSCKFGNAKLIGATLLILFFPNLQRLPQRTISGTWYVVCVWSVGLCGLYVLCMCSVGLCGLCGLFFGVGNDHVVDPEID